MLPFIPLTTLQIGVKAAKEDGGNKSARKDDDSEKEALSSLLEELSDDVKNQILSMLRQEHDDEVMNLCLSNTKWKTLCDNNPSLIVHTNVTLRKALILISIGRTHRRRKISNSYDDL